MRQISDSHSDQRVILMNEPAGAVVSCGGVGSGQRMRQYLDKPGNEVGAAQQLLRIAAQARDSVPAAATVDTDHDPDVSPVRVRLHDLRGAERVVRQLDV